MLDKINELIEIAKSYMEEGYDILEAIRLAEEEIQRMYFE